MSDDDFLRDLEKEAADLSTMPSDAGAARLQKAAQHMVELQTRKDELEEDLKKVNVELWDIQTKSLPDLFSEIGTDIIGVPSANVDVVVKPYVMANIKADWEEEKREAGFAEVERVGGGDIIRNEVVVVFPRGHYDELLEWIEKVRGLNLEFDPPDMNVTKTVPWNTLTAFVKEQVEKGTALDLEKLGATVGQIAKIQKRKS